MITKAIIPAAGKGTRMQSVTADPKALLPLGDTPVLGWIIQEAARAGIREIGLIVSPDARETFEAYLASAPQPVEITLIEQASAGGLGAAVARGEAFVGGERFAVLLGDHVRPSGAAGLRALMALAELRHAAWAAGVQQVDADQAGLCGVAAGVAIADVPGGYRCERLIEKPTPAELELLRSPDSGMESYFAHNGQYVFSPALFDALRGVRAELSENEELSLTAAQQRLLARRSAECYLLSVPGVVWDTGNPDGYARAQHECCESDCQDQPSTL